MENFRANKAIDTLKALCAFGLLMFLLMGALTACSPTGDSADKLPAEEWVQTYPIDGALKEFYEAMAKKAPLGQVISTAIVDSNGKTCQFAENVELCYDPNAKAPDRYNFASLGGKLIKTPEAPFNLPPDSNDPEPRFVDGYVINYRLVSLYDNLGGKRYVGSVLSNWKENPEKNRIEQYFENVGMAVDLGDPNAQPYLLPYGSYFCRQNTPDGKSCSSHLDEYWNIVRSDLVKKPHAPLLDRVGGPVFTGDPRLEAKTLSNGETEQLYANIFVYFTADDPNTLRLRPLAVILGYKDGPHSPLHAKSSQPGVTFILIKGDLGHNVLIEFENYNAMRSSGELAGLPITEIFQTNDKKIYEQCFENYCLLYNPSAPEDKRVSMAPLGDEYLKKFPAEAPQLLNNIFNSENIVLVASAEKVEVGINDNQYLRIVVLSRSSNEPIENVEAYAELSVPNKGISKIFDFPATDANGLSTLKIPSIDGLAEKDDVNFKVCLRFPSDQPNCYSSTYLIWDPQ